jgi:sarcosine oxidase subunit gamma
VHDLDLTSNHPFHGLHRNQKEITLSGITTRALVSLATPVGGHETLERELVNTYGTHLPQCGNSTLSKDGKIRFLGLQRDLNFALIEDAKDWIFESWASSLKEVGYVTDQSDSWVDLRIEGVNVVQVLARICPLDLHLNTFPEGSVSRTVMEHLAVIILREKKNSFLLMSPRSSANSFLHALETSISNVL